MNANPQIFPTSVFCGSQTDYLNDSHQFRMIKIPILKAMIVKIPNNNPLLVLRSLILDDQDPKFKTPLRFYC